MRLTQETRHQTAGREHRGMLRNGLARMLLAIVPCAWLIPLCAQAAAAPRSAAIASRYERIMVHGKSLEGNLAGDPPDRMVSVYLPPSYATSRGRRYPVLYFLHGFWDTDTSLFVPEERSYLNIPLAADRAYAQGAREMIIVTPNALTRFSGSMYSSSPVTGDWEAFITQDLVAYIDAHYRTLARPESRGLAGHSMGGYGTLRLGMKHARVFSSLYAMSPCCLAPSLEPQNTVLASAWETVANVRSDEDIARLEFLPRVVLASAAAWSPEPQNPPLYLALPVVGGKPVPEVIANWVANAPLAMVPQYLPNLRTYVGIAFEAGNSDTQTGIVQSVREMDRLLTKHGIIHTAKFYDGDHNDRIEERIASEVLPFFSQHLSFTAHGRERAQ